MLETRAFQASRVCRMLVVLIFSRGDAEAQRIKGFLWCSSASPRLCAKLLFAVFLVLNQFQDHCSDFFGNQTDILAKSFDPVPNAGCFDFLARRRGDAEEKIKFLFSAPLRLCAKLFFSQFFPTGCDSGTRFCRITQQTTAYPFWPPAHPGATGLRLTAHAAACFRPGFPERRQPERR